MTLSYKKYDAQLHHRISYPDHFASYLTPVRIHSLQNCLLASFTALLNDWKSLSFCSSFLITRASFFIPFLWSTSSFDVPKITHLCEDIVLLISVFICWKKLPLLISLIPIASIPFPRDRLLSNSIIYFLARVDSFFSKRHHLQKKGLHTVLQILLL